MRRRGGKPVFAGIARTRDVDAYLRGTAHDDADRHRRRPVRADVPARTGGDRRPRAPADQGFWVATAGTARKPLDWKVKDGTWSVVVMNADGSAGVDARVSAGASLPFLDELELAAWIAAALLPRARQAACSPAASGVAPMRPE